MNPRKTLVYVVFVLMVAGGLVLSLRPPPPFIVFTGFRQTQSGKAAVFLITNASSSAYCYVSTPGGTAPLNYVVRGQAGSDWRMLGRASRGVAELRTLAPHSSVEFTVEQSHIPLRPFEVGVEFERGTAEQVQLRWNRKVPYSVGREPNYTWSQPTP